MSLDDPYDADNLFLRIIEGHAPCARIYEDGSTLAFLDAYPQSRGHTLVVPKKARARHLLDMPAHELGPYMNAVQHVAKRIVACLAPDGLSVHQYNGRPAGQSIFHLHVHLVPHYAGFPISAHGEAPAANAAELERLADQLRDG